MIYIEIVDEQPRRTTIFSKVAQRNYTECITTEYEDYTIHNEKYLYKDGEIVLNPNYEEEQKKKERERLNLLSMTKREMFLGLYQAKQITPDMLKAQITEPTALIEFEYANDYFRGNPLIDLIGAQLGLTTEMLDKFFETKDYHYLTTCTLTVNATPVEATVTGAGIYHYGSTVDVIVKCEGYITYAETLTLTEDKALNVELEKEVIDENTTDTDE